MRERVELLVGRVTRAMWVMTFHAACARMLRADADQLGYTRQFTIYDAADQRRLIKRCLDDLGIDTKRFTPRAMQSQISDAKNKLRSRRGLPPARRLALRADRRRRLRAYERELHRMNAMDFDDLLVRAVRLLELLPGGPRPLRGRLPLGAWSTSTRTPTTPSTAGSSCSTSEHRNLAVVGDDAQCLVAGTPITMGDGIDQADRGGRGGRSGAVVLRKRRLPSGTGDRDFESLRADGRRDHDRGRSPDRQHAGAHALRGLSRRATRRSST